MKCLLALVLLVVAMIVGLGAFVWSGTYYIGADSPHWPITTKLLNTLRERSIETRIDSIDVPALDNSALIAEGAEHYAGMCSGCHVAPGRSASEIRKGLYPKPPNLTRYTPDPATAFWVVKHGIKMSGMPAWGVTHSDEQIWAIVAYLQQQPTMSVEHYRELTTTDTAAETLEHSHAPEQEHEHDHEHEPRSEA